MGSDEPEPSDAPTQAAPSAATANTLAAPVVGAPAIIDTQRYARGALIGRGGMGEVRVCDDAHVGRQVAFKTMRGTGDAAQQARFLREARLQARLEHPSIVPVYELGSGPDGAPFFTMRRIGGTTLAEVIEALRRGDSDAVRRFSRRRLLGDFVRVAQAVAYAHEQGVVHRDIKPANIIVSDFGEVYLLDWGVAKVRGETWVELSVDSASGDGVHTEAGSVLGTLGYMPPEQLEGGGSEVDRRADVYALGATLFELLTLEPLHERRDTPSLIQSTLDGVDARTSVRAPERDVAPELERICVRATMQAKDDRYPDAGALIEDIERFLDGDRDAQRRRELAIEHAQRATAALVDAKHDLEARARAAREAGRALAFDPDRREALEVITRLLVEPPAVVPPEVEAEVRATDVEGSRAMARFGALSRGTGFILLALIVWMGVRVWWPFWTLAVLLVFGTVSAAVFSLRGRARPLPAPVLVMNALLLGLFATALGPFVLVPGLAAATAAMFLLGGALRATPVAIAGIAAIVVPWLLSVFDVIPSSYRMVDGVMQIVPVLADLPAVPTTVLLLVNSISVVLMVVFAVDGARKRLRDSRRQQLVQAWHLSHLVPKATAA